MVRLPIFIILLGILMVASNNTRIPTQNNPPYNLQQKKIYGMI